MRSMKMTRRLIVVSGVDCVGKSTQIEMLRAAEELRGAAVQVVWHRPGYSPALDLLRRLVRRVHPKALPTTADAAARERFFSNSRARRLWATIAVLDTLLRYALALRFYLLLGRVVVCDRYMEDGVLDLRLRFPELNVERWLLTRLTRLAIPRPDLHFLLTIPRATMLQRMDSKREPYPDPSDVRDRRYAEYTQMARSGEFVVIDASKSIEAVHAEMLVALATAERATGRRK